MRVLSLIASSTEIVCALGMEHHLVGRSHECDYPPSIKRLPSVTEPKFPVAGSSAEIDRHVRAIVEKALSVYRVNPELIAELKPDVVITQSQCRVCAVSLSDVEEALAEVLGSQPQVVSLEPNDLEDVWQDIGRVARALKVSGRGDALVRTLRGRMTTISQEAQRLPEQPVTCCIEWIDPLMAAGNWMPTLIELAGGRAAFGETGKHAPPMTWEELVARNPEVLVVMPCGFEIARSVADLPALTGREEWPRLAAVRARRTYVADGNQYFNRPGPRLADSLEILAELLHPETFSFGHRDRGWRAL